MVKVGSSFASLHLGVSIISQLHWINWYAINILIKNIYTLDLRVDLLVQEIFPARTLLSICELITF